jgi:hypothetical protein
MAFKVSRWTLAGLTFFVIIGKVFCGRVDRKGWKHLSEGQNQYALFLSWSCNRCFSSVDDIDSSICVVPLYYICSGSVTKAANPSHRTQLILPSVVPVLEESANANEIIILIENFRAAGLCV